MKKVIFIDIDGTLCNSKGEITERTRNVINKVQEQGNIVVISSGRNIQDIVSFYSNASYCIALNGAIVYDIKNEKIIHQEFINEELVLKLYQLACELNLNISFNSFYEKYVNYSGTAKLITDLSDLKQPFNQSVIWHKDFNLMFEIKNKLKDFPFLKIVNQSRDMVYGDENYAHKDRFIDVTNSNVSKGNGIKILLNYLGLTKEGSIAIGDGINDLSMFEVVGIKVAMGNADSFLKEKADYITLSNDENGVAYYLGKLVK